MRDQSADAPFALRLATDDREALPEVIRTAFPALDMRVLHAPRDEPVHLQHDIVGDGRLSYHRSTLTVGSRATGDLAEATVVAIRRAGAIRVEAGQDRLDFTRPLLYPEHGLRITSDHHDVELVAIQHAALARAAQGLTGDEAHRLRFTGSAPVTAAAEQYWRAVHLHIGSVLSDPVMRAESLLRAEALRLAVRAVLLTFPNTALTAGPPADAAAAQTAVDAATSFIEANAHRAIELQDIADAAHAEPRALSQAFRRRHGRTPLQFLRDTRFDFVRRTLVESDPWSTTSIRQVAARWGFASTGRFAADYRQRFGETPSATLRR